MMNMRLDMELKNKILVLDDDVDFTNEIYLKPLQKSGFLFSLNIC